MTDHTTDLAALELAAFRIGEVLRAAFDREQTMRLGFARGLGLIDDQLEPFTALGTVDETAFPMCEHTVTVEWGYSIDELIDDEEPMPATEDAARWHAEHDGATVYRRQIDVTEWLPVR